MNEYHITITATHHLFADIVVMAHSEEDALALVEEQSDSIDWSDGDFDVDDPYIDTGPDFYSTQTLVQEEEDDGDEE